jgi:HD-GYP domain-containing protein (c-di-GMP phosphodiesterase class II)
MSFRAYAYITAVGAVGAVLLASRLMNLEFSWQDFGLALIILASAAFFAEIYELDILPKWTISTGVAMTMSSIYIGGEALAILVMVFSFIPAEIIQRWERIRSHGFFSFLLYAAFNIGQIAISIVVAAWVFEQLGGHTPPYVSVQAFGTLVITFGIYEILNAVMVSIGMSLTAGTRLTYTLRYSLKYLHIHFLTLGIISILLTIVYYSEPLNLLFALMPLALAHFSMRNYLNLRQQSHAALMLIVELLEKRDKYTGEHSKHVTHIAVLLAHELEISDEAIEDIEMGAAVHDIGKVGIPDAILHKKGPLDEEEWEEMKTHPVVGAEITGKLEIYKNVVPLVRHEHEHWNGKGYPDGLQGEEIPLGARVVAVADVYSALITPREYRSPLQYTHEQACEILKEMAGAVLDPKLVEIFISKLKVEDLVFKPDEDKAA